MFCYEYVKMQIYLGCFDIIDSFCILFITLLLPALRSFIINDLFTLYWLLLKINYEERESERERERERELSLIHI